MSAAAAPPPPDDAQLPVPAPSCNLPARPADVHGGILLGGRPLPLDVFERVLEDASKKRHALLKWIFQELRPGIDWIFIHSRVGAKGQKRWCRLHGCRVLYQCPDGKVTPQKAPDRKLAATCPDCQARPSLTKPGSEAAFQLFEVVPEWEIDEPMLRVFQNSKQVVIAFVCHARSTHDGSIRAEGRGACALSETFGDVNSCIKRGKKRAATDCALALGLSCAFGADAEMSEDVQVRDGGAVVDVAPAGEARADEDGPAAPDADAPAAQPINVPEPPTKLVVFDEASFVVGAVWSQKDRARRLRLLGWPSAWAVGTFSDKPVVAGDVLTARVVKMKRYDAGQWTECTTLRADERGSVQLQRIRPVGEPEPEAPPSPDEDGQAPSGPDPTAVLEAARRELAKFLDGVVARETVKHRDRKDPEAAARAAVEDRLRVAVKSIFGPSAELSVCKTCDDPEKLASFHAHLIEAEVPF